METPVGAPFKEKLRIEITKLREMTLKEKLEYIWEYYKFFIIGVLIVLLITGSLLNMWLFNPTPGTALFISWNSGFATDEQFEDLKEALEERLIEDKKYEEVVISHFLTSAVDPLVEVASTQRIVAMMATGAIDIFILDFKLLEEKTKSGFIRPMEKILAEVKAINPQVFETIEKNITYVMYENDEENASMRLMGISIGGSPLFSKVGIIEQELYFSLAMTTENTEIIIKTLIALFE